MSETSNGPVSASPESAATPESTEQNNTQKPAANEQAPLAPTKKKYTYKADGEDISEELDDTELTKRLSLSKAAQKRMSEAHKLQVQAQQLIKEFNENPKAVFKRLDNKAARSAAEEFLLEQIQQEMMSPEERERQEERRLLKQYQESEKKQKEEHETRYAKELEDKAASDYDRTITEALRTSGLPKSPATVKRMANLLYKNLELGLDLSPADLVEEVKKSYYSEFKEMFGTAEASFILDMFGPDLANKIRKNDLEKFKTKLTPQNKTTVPNFQNSEPEPRKMRAHEYDEYLRNKIKK